MHKKRDKLIKGMKYYFFKTFFFFHVSLRHLLVSLSIEWVQPRRNGDPADPTASE